MLKRGIPGDGSRSPLICIDCRYIRERPSGIGWLVQALVDHLPAMAPEYRFLLMRHPKAPAPLSSAPNVEERVVVAEANGPATLLFPHRIVDLSGVALFHAPSNILPLRLDVPSVVTIHDIMWIKHPDWACKPWWLGRVRGRVEAGYYGTGIRNALRNATRIAAISRATKDEIGTVDRQAESRTRITLSGVSERFRPLAEPVRGRAVAEAMARWLPGAAGYILTVGQFAGYKNHARVVRAFARAFADYPGVHLALVQRLGPGARVLRSVAHELGLGERVHFLASVPFEDLVALMNGAVALCHPSLYEGFGNPPAEAMACGCPVVTSNRSSMPEVAGGAALLVDPEDVDSIAEGLRRVALEAGLAETLRRKGLARAGELSWKAFARSNLDIYREILG
jgi:glycosyltransferase involved in cell wall biosynthesis